jgi:hypothetical protein
MPKSDLELAPAPAPLDAAVLVSAILPTFRPVGAVITVAVIVSLQDKPTSVTPVEVAPAESTVKSTRTKAAVVRVSPPTTVKEVCADGPTNAATLVPATAEAGATEDRTPKPNAEIVTSAMRLKINFVDIYFLSLIAGETFPPTNGKEILFAS